MTVISIWFWNWNLFSAFSIVVLKLIWNSTWNKIICIFCTALVLMKQLLIKIRITLKKETYIS